MTPLVLQTLSRGAPVQPMWEQSHDVPVEVWRQRAPYKHCGHSVREREAIEGQNEEGMEEGGKCTGKVVLVIVIRNRVHTRISTFRYLCNPCIIANYYRKKKRRGGSGGGKVGKGGKRDERGRGRKRGWWERGSSLLRFLTLGGWGYGG